MKIGVFFEYYQPFHETKDPGQLVLGFLDIGIPSEMITEAKPELKQYDAPFPIKFITRGEALDVSYWRAATNDVIVAYTWLSRHYLQVISAMKKAGKVVLVKGDTDGRCSFPLFPRSLYVNNLWTKKGIKNLLRKLILRLHKHQRGEWLAEHIRLADRVIVESPQAQANLAYIMLHWGKPELVRKISVVPNPVSSDIIDSSIPVKCKQIVAIGRWEDVWPKNTATMAKVVCHFATMKPDYEIVVIGSGEDIVQRLIAKASSQQPIRLHLTGRLPHNEVVNYLGRSQILFTPSNWEGFSIAAAEAVCMGCTIVGTPLESLHFLTRGGFSGTLASNFTEDALLSALLIDSSKWEAGTYAPEDISHFWRSRLNRRAIAKSFLHLVERV